MLRNVPRIRDVDAMIGAARGPRRAGRVARRQRGRRRAPRRWTTRTPRSTASWPSASAPRSCSPARCWRASGASRCRRRAATSSAAGGWIRTSTRSARWARTSRSTATSCCARPGGLRAGDVFMDEPSVMATENALMAAALTPGTTRDRQRRLRAPRPGPRAHAGEDGRRHPGHRLQRAHRAPAAERLRGCEHDVGPDHIEIGSFMALAGVTGGELRIKDIVPDDLRMIRLVFDRLGLRSELDGDDVVVPGGPEARRDARRRRVQVQGPGRAVAGVPGRPDARSRSRWRPSREGSVLIHEWMFENRLIFTDKLGLMGADIILCDPHRAIVTGPRRLRGERVESPDIRAGMAMLIAALCAEGARRSATSARSTAATSASTSACAPWARASSASPPSRSTPPEIAVGATAMTHRIPSGTRDVLPDEMRELRAITEAVRACSRRAATARSTRPRSSTPRRCERAELGDARPAYRCSTSTARCSCCART